MADDKPILARLMEVIEDRQRRRPPGSYTVELFEGGADLIGAKVADLIFHTLVLLAHCRVSWSDVEVELARRFGTSDLAEKASHRSP
jgi:phosphoribosyl-ATP pyrophosphohydrolase